MLLASTCKTCTIGKYWRLRCHFGIHVQDVQAANTGGCGASTQDLCKRQIPGCGCHFGIHVQDLCKRQILGGCGASTCKVAEAANTRRLWLSASTCKSCASGKYSEIVGATSASTQNCASSKYPEVVGAASTSMCKSCASGNLGDCGWDFIAIYLAGKGEYFWVSGMSHKMPTGSFFSGGSVCSFCTRGRWSEVNAQSFNTCQPCPAGKARNSWRICI